MTSKLALGATVAAIVLCTTSLGASAQTYEVTELVPGSAFTACTDLESTKPDACSPAASRVPRSKATAKRPWSPGI